MTAPGPTTTPRDVFWVDGSVPGRIVLLSRNPVAEAIQAVAAAAGRTTLLVEKDEGGTGVRAFAELTLDESDAVVLCDHDAPDAAPVLRGALGSPVRYVAMMASRRRATQILAELAEEGVANVGKLHVPAGLDIGGKSPGEIALSVVAEVVAEGHGRPGGALRAG